MNNILNEDNKSIEELIYYIENKIKELKDKNQLEIKDLKKLHNLYLNIINKWELKNHLLNVEINKKDEDIITNKLLEFISYLNKIK
jgi:hypothetical protein